ncbi:MAG TPA: MnmC family methyltransferase [Chthoniobacteraceae bacterium]|jgi:tRNA U34 5-methylaminomethyl-2-thiouridine-forming methyltransferase MnmC
MRAESFELVTVASGAQSVRSREYGETFHPVVGPMAEARGLHVRQQRLVERARATSGEFVIWDVGLGAGANSVAVLEAFAGVDRGAKIALHSFDQSTAPLAFALAHAEELGYVAPFAEAFQDLLETGSAAAGPVKWQLHPGDFRQSLHLPEIPAPHAILYDPYSPATNPELWTLEHFAALFSRLDPARECLLTNYTRSTAARVTLLLARFSVGLGHATGEKDQTTIASNSLPLLEEPLDCSWLQRVRRSTQSAPFRNHPQPGPITAEDLAALSAHPQFVRNIAC